MADEILTEGQLAELMHVTPAHVRALANDGKLPGFKLAADDGWRFVKSQVLAALASLAEAEQAHRKEIAKTFEKAKQAGAVPARPGRRSKTDIKNIMEKYGPTYGAKA